MPTARPKTKNRENSDGQDWGMLIFESLSAGVFAVFITLAIILVLAGVYGLVVWPLTHWDLAQVSVETFGKFLLCLVFAVGVIAGFWCFSGEAFKKKSARRNGKPPAQVKYRGAR